MNVGIVGCGFIGLKHARSMAKVPDCQLVALSDLVPDRMNRLISEYSGLLPVADRQWVRQYERFDDLIQDPTVDVVVVATISGMHAKIADCALKKGKHVIVEKPLSLSIEEARELLNTAKRYGRKVAVCHQKRFFPHLREIRELIRDEKIGKLIHGGVSLMYNRDDRYYSEAKWRGTWEQDGGVLLNQAIHNIDLLLWMTGSPRVVHAQIARLMRPIEAEDTAIVSMRLHNGALARIEATVCTHPSSAFERIELVGTEGALAISGKHLENIEKWMVNGASRPVFQVIDPYEALYSDFITAIRDDREPFINGTEGFIALETILAAYRSAKSQSPVELPISSFSMSEMNDFKM